MANIDLGIWPPPVIAFTLIYIVNSFRFASTFGRSNYAISRHHTIPSYRHLLAVCVCWNRFPSLRLYMFLFKCAISILGRNIPRPSQRMWGWVCVYVWWLLLLFNWINKQYQDDGWWRDVGSFALYIFDGSSDASDDDERRSLFVQLL